MTHTEQFRKIAAELGDLYEKKNAAYGNSFGDTFQKLGIISAVTRISDKYNRLCNLVTNPDIDNLGESIDDTLRDMASYCIMTVIELQKPEAKGAKYSLSIPYNAKPLATFKNLEIRNGDKFLCLEDVVMEDGELAYRKGGLYLSEVDSCITNLQCDRNYVWGNNWPKHFKRIK